MNNDNIFDFNDPKPTQILIDELNIIEEYWIFKPETETKSQIESDFDIIDQHFIIKSTDDKLFDSTSPTILDDDSTFNRSTAINSIFESTQNSHIKSNRPVSASIPIPQKKISSFASSNKGNSMQNHFFCELNSENSTVEYNKSLIFLHSVKHGCGLDTSLSFIGADAPTLKSSTEENTTSILLNSKSVFRHARSTDKTIKIGSATKTMVFFYPNQDVTPETTPKLTYQQIPPVIDNQEQKLSGEMPKLSLGS